jgi:putative PIN family toxin of toxin-antitoxin system
MKVVLDTNVWVSAFLSPLGTPGRLLDAMRTGHVRVATSERLWSELIRIVHEPKVRNVLEAHGTWDAAELILATRPRIDCVDAETPIDRWVPDDPDDDWVIQCALTTKAEYIVSGDRHLVSLGQIGQIRIVSPAGFLSILGETP